MVDGEGEDESRSKRKIKESNRICRQGKVLPFVNWLGDNEFMTWTSFFSIRFTLPVAREHGELMHWRETVKVLNVIYTRNEKAAQAT